jgi:hypothetical protein
MAISRDQSATRVFWNMLVNITIFDKLYLIIKSRFAEIMPAPMDCYETFATVKILSCILCLDKCPMHLSYMYISTSIKSPILWGPKQWHTSWVCYPLYSRKVICHMWYSSTFCAIKYQSLCACDIIMTFIVKVSNNQQYENLFLKLILQEHFISPLTMWDHVSAQL